MHKYNCIIGGIVKHRHGGYTFKIIFDDIETAKKYKEQLIWFTKDDFKKVMVRKGYYDDML